MKYFFTFLIVGVFALSSCNSGHDSHEGHDHSSTSVCKINGMTCTGCEQTVTAKLSQVEGLTVESISFKDGQAICKFNKEEVSQEQIKEALGDDYELVSVTDKTEPSK